MLHAKPNKIIMKLTTVAVEPQRCKQDPTGVVVVTSTFLMYDYFISCYIIILYFITYITV